jgi:histidinol-phosphate aminotransferase
MNRSAPPPRGPVADSDLERPDWTRGEARDPALLWLDKNENVDPELARITRAVLADVAAEALYAYPESGPLYRKLADHLGLRPDNLLLAHGSDGVIRSVFEAFVNPSDVVIHTRPTFAMYGVYSRMYGARAVTLDYAPSNDGPVLHIDTVMDAILASKARVVCLPNPDSPTGTVFSPEALRRIIAAAQEADAAILIDEAYHPFYAQTALAWIDEFPNLVVARSTGKAWGLAGLRLGYAAASPKVAAWLHKVRPMYEANAVAVAVFERLLDHCDAMEASVRRINAGKDYFVREMNALGLRTLTGQGNFVHVAFGAHADRVHEALADLVLYRKGFTEPCLAGFSRFTAAPAGILMPVIERISETVAQRTIP